MGNTSSQSLKQYITSNANYTQNVSATLNLQNSSTINSTNMNDINISAGTSAECCCKEYGLNSGKCKTTWPPNMCPPGSIQCKELKIDQTAESNAMAIQQINSEFAQQLSTQLQNTAQADITNALDQLQQNDLISGVFNQSRQHVETEITNNINTTLNSDTVMHIVNSSVVNSVNANKTSFVICGDLIGDQCEFSQNASSKVVIHNILSSIGDLTQNNKEINDFYSKINDALTNKQQGVVGTIGDIFNKFYDTFGRIGIFFMIGGAIVLFILILLPVVFNLMG